MPRLFRFPENRYIGTRHDMRFHDCDDPTQFESLAQRVADGDLLDRKELQCFGPDSEAEARNRGFRPV